ncbi:MAG: DUF2058 domain-containing protein [Desulfobulbaceae bacterium]|nr:DUF2058 domain-containing protein [Desulfobulbaceae bacterium]
MGNPFQDQFIKAGLVNKKQVNKVNIEQRTKQKEQRRNKNEVTVDRTVELALQQKKDQARQSNAQRNLAAREKEITAQIKQMTAMHRVQAGKGESSFHFADANKIKKMYLSKEIINQLSVGSLGIIKVEDKYEIVPAEIAIKIRDRRPEVLLLLNTSQAPDPNDPYAEFPIPDDYDW